MLDLRGITVIKMKKMFIFLLDIPILKFYISLSNIY